MSYIICSFLLSTFLLLIFLSVSVKTKWDKNSGVTFECGFSSSFVSRFSFSMHFFTVGLIFLFLDLELCMIMPFLNESFSSVKLMLLSWMFVTALLLGLLYEWEKKELEWKF